MTSVFLMPVVFADAPCRMMVKKLNVLTPRTKSSRTKKTLVADVPCCKQSFSCCHIVSLTFSILLTPQVLLCFSLLSL